MELRACVCAGADFENVGANCDRGGELILQRLGRGRPAQVVAGNDDADLPLPGLCEQRRKILRGAQLEIDPTGVGEESPKQPAARSTGEPAASAFGRMPRRENERCTQPRQRLSDFRQTIPKRIEAQLEKIRRLAEAPGGAQSSSICNHTDECTATFDRLSRKPILRSGPELAMGKVVPH